MKLNARALALSSGIVGGLIIFLVTILMVLEGHSGQNLGHLSAIYIGYSVSFVGRVIGLIWGFVTMFVVAWLFAYLYNKLSGSSVQG
jgi:hypothetical protein